LVLRGLTKKTHNVYSSDAAGGSFHLALKRTLTKSSVTRVA